MDAVIDYAKSEDICRSAQLLAYFGEPGSKFCGQCDVCKGEHLSGISNAEFAEIYQRVIELLGEGAKEVRELYGTGEGSEKGTVRVVRWLMDQGIIELNNSSRLILKKQ